MVPAIDQQTLHAGEPGEVHCKRDSLGGIEARELAITFTC